MKNIRGRLVLNKRLFSRKTQYFLLPFIQRRATSEIVFFQNIENRPLVKPIGLKSNPELGPCA